MMIGSCRLSQRGKKVRIPATMTSTLRMKRKLLCLGPWMAIAAAAQSYHPLPAEVSCGHSGRSRIYASCAELACGSDSSAVQVGVDVLAFVLQTDPQRSVAAPQEGFSLEPPPTREPYDKFAPVWRTPPMPVAGPIVVQSQAPGGTKLSIRLSAPLLSGPRYRRLDASTLEISLPGARWLPNEFEAPKAGYVEEVRAEQGGSELRLIFRLSRPMGVQMGESPGEVHLSLIKPAVGDGRLASKIVVVDAGHGGSDPGARSPDGSVREKDLTLSIATLISDRLTTEGATVILTRKSDVRIALKERSEIANRNGADFFLSVHINSSQVPGKSTGGITFYHAQDPIGRLLADCIQAEIAKVSKLPNMGTWSDTRIYDSGFAVLRYATMPAVLIEMGFINHAGDRARMLTKDFQTAVASAIVKGLRVYLGDAKPQE